MAGDWIKMRSNLWDHPKVVRIVSAICPQSVRDMSARCRILGALFRTWSLADAHSDDGVLDGYDAEALDFAVGIDGWSLNLQHVGWLIVEPQRLILPRFTEHGGQTAKRRAEDAARKGRVRKASANCPQIVRENAEQRREEKRRDIESTNVLSGPAKKTTQFIKPTLAEVVAYATEASLDDASEEFVDYYESNGWKVGKNSMKDWKAAYRKWLRSPFRLAAAKSAGSRVPTAEDHANWTPFGGVD